MGNKKTPLIQKLRNTGGTLVVFPSASEDIGLNLQATTSGVAMSHYALLDIPKLSIDKCLAECSKEIDVKGDPNLAMSMSLQNYLMNFETTLINNSEYNYQALATVSEKAFWHWAMHIGILDPDTLDNTKCGNASIYIESGYDTDPEIADNTVIKCFGSIDAGNSLSTEFGMFNETYITIPTSYGAGPVFLESSSDDNYILGSKIPIDENHLAGRDDSLSYYTYTEGQDYPFYDEKVSNTAFYQICNVKDGLTIVKDLNAIKKYATKRFNDDSLIIGSFDDINIDNQNKFGVDKEFKFNAILLYYSVYDQDDLIKTAYATNLFGIIFLDGCKSIDTNDGNFVIPELTKRKSTIDSFGNSFSFRVNLKTMSVYDNTDAVIQDNTTTSGISAVEFSDAISNMNRAIDIMNSNLQAVKAIQDKYAAILAYYDDMHQTIDDLSTCLNAYLKGTRSSLVDTSVLYTNVIAPNEKNPNNDIQILTRGTLKDSKGNSIYKPVLNVKDDMISIEKLISGTSNIYESFVNIVDTSICDKNIFQEDPDKDVYTTAVEETLDQIVDPSKLCIKVKESYIGIKNAVYIDSNSPIFNNDMTQHSLQRFLDKDNNVNYIEFIPYILAKLQQISEAIGR